MPCGIYKIENKQTKKFYIGSSINIEQRWYSHKSKLRRDTHCNQHLQNAWNKYGEDNFVFSILIEVDEEMLITTEQEYLDETQCYDREIGYNKASCAAAPARGMIVSEETRRKISEAVKSRPPRSEETRRRQSEALKGRTFSAETRKKMSEAKKGKAPAVSFLPPSEEGRKRISEYAKTRTGHKNPNSRLTPEQVASMKKDFADRKLTNKQMAEKYGVSVSTVKRLKSGNTYR